MPNPKKQTLAKKTYEQTEAQWQADTRIFDVHMELVPTDGANRGKHKLANGINIYRDLAFVEDGGTGGGTILSVEGVRYDELITIFGFIDAQSDMVIDFTNLAEYPNIALASYVSSAQIETNQLVGMPYQFDLNDFHIAFLNPDAGALGPEGAAVQATFMIKYA